ncbi:MAG TPA: flagellar filament outer layer protein FlaA [Spirochaetia bacterium]|nr:flagellar filament outer layer protein FlaA [Spirochaetia bacterium]
MKRFGILLSITLLCVAFSAYADESVLIDFSKLTADSENGENTATLIDFSDKAGTSFSDEEKAHMKTSLAIQNWEVVLASSSRTVLNQSLSYTKEATVGQNAKRFPNEKVLGIRVHFPEEPFNSWAFVKPPFEIPAYMRKTQVNADGTLVEDETDRQGTKFDGYGVVKNVGVIKSISVNVYGSNFPNGFGIVLKDQNNEEQTIFVGYLDFDGWKTITWNNPNYIAEVKNREVKKYPLYPRASPMRKLSGFMLYKDANDEGGDMITYVKDVSIVYDKAVLSMERDIDDEALWGILDKREQARRTAEFTKLGNLQVLRYLEAQKMHKETEATAAK